MSDKNKVILFVPRDESRGQTYQYIKGNKKTARINIKKKMMEVFRSFIKQVLKVHCLNQ